MILTCGPTWLSTLMILTAIIWVWTYPRNKEKTQNAV